MTQFTHQNRTSPVTELLTIFGNTNMKNTFRFFKCSVYRATYVIEERVV